MDLLPLAVAVAVAGPFAVVPTTPTASAPITATSAAVRPGDASEPWSAPVTRLDVARPFDAPAKNWLPGHRGVDLRAAAGSEVRAPAPGRVTFVGMVAGRPVLSIDHEDPRRPGDTIRTTYEPVRSALTSGTTVRTGDVVGTVADDSHCAGGCVHWGARREDGYVDPLSFLQGEIRLWTPQSTG